MRNVTYRVVPQSVLRKKVSTYLKQTVALEQHWNTSVTAEMLERLEELFAALGDDPCWSASVWPGRPW
ncbi:MAG: hypothetical protein V3S47_02235 [Acidobacteriota bacterium]